jgi:hypothetical protein
MSDTTRNDIRNLLKNFGIQADEAITAHLDSLSTSRPLHIRITLADLTDYGQTPPDEELHLEIEGEIRP